MKPSDEAIENTRALATASGWIHSAVEFIAMHEERAIVEIVYERTRTRLLMPCCPLHHLLGLSDATICVVTPGQPVDGIEFHWSGAVAEVRERLRRAA